MLICRFNNILLITDVNLLLECQNTFGVQTNNRRNTDSTVINPFAPGDFAEKPVLKLAEWFSGYCHAIKS